MIYKKNPLDRVICQVRFPAILRIDTQIPADFQDAIRKEFPGFCEKEELAFPLPQRAQKEGPTEVLRQMLPTETKNYEFSSEDGNWVVNLTRTFLALTARRYIRRQEFRDRLKTPLEALRETYEPACFSRIGLRYVDIIRRSDLGLQDVPWTELLQPHVLGLLSSPDKAVEASIRTFEAKCELQLEDGSSMARIVTALVEGRENNEPCFMVDTDFYTTQKTPISEVQNKLDYFHVRGSRLIRWFIKDKLHDAMQPEEAE
ncbi:MAG: TIGR04255 family protein [Sedimentisphaerales bacterium]|nr:TIGR04255 family protein [Sedimentisphaerales bacterium]